MLLSLYKAKPIICQPNFQIVIHLLKRLDPNKHLGLQIWEKGKRMQKSPRLWESLCPSTLASHTYFLPVLYLDSEQSSKAALKAFSQSGKKRKEKLRPTWECICFECLLPALSDVWPYTKQKGILDVDSLSDPSPWSKTYSQHLQPSWSYLRQLSTENRIPASIDTRNWGPNDFEIILQNTIFAKICSRHLLF